MGSNEPPPFEPPQQGFIPSNQEIPQLAPPKDPMKGNTDVKTQSESKSLGPNPSRVLCPFCNASIITTVKLEATAKTYITDAILFCIQCILCVTVPYNKKAFHVHTHYCPNCKACLGKYKED